MKWNRTIVKAVVITFVTIIATSFFIKWTFDHDGETITLGGDDPTRSAAADPGSSPTVESGDIDPESGLPWVLEEELPVEGQGTLALIDQGGPFPFPDKDGSTFGNFEGLLPDHTSASAVSTCTSRHARNSCPAPGGRRARSGPTADRPAVGRACPRMDPPRGGGKAASAPWPRNSP